MPSMMVLGGESFGRYLGQENRAFMMGLVLLQIPENSEIPESSLLFLPSEDTVRSLQPKRGPSSDHAEIPVSDFQPAELW